MRHKNSLKKSKISFFINIYNKIMSRGPSIINRIRLKTVFKNEDIHLIPKTTKKLDGCLIWLHGMLESAETYLPKFE